ENQSWVGALTTILDTCAMLISTVESADRYQARLTFAMARHAAVDLALVFGTPPEAPAPDRLSDERFERLRQTLIKAGLAAPSGSGAAGALGELRGLSEPFVNALAARFLFVLPAFEPDKAPVDNWQTSAWTRRTPGLAELPAPGGDDHFD